jgi:hypothetical protein
MAETKGQYLGNVSPQTPVLSAEIRAAFDQLEIETAGLDRESEAIGNLVNAADERLRKIGPKIAMWLDDEIASTKKLPWGSYRAYQVGWARISDSEWGLASRVIEVSAEKKSQVLGWHNISDVEAGIDAKAPLRVALCKAPLNLRIAALEKLPKLIETLAKLARRQRQALENIRSAIEEK